MRECQCQGECGRSDRHLSLKGFCYDIHKETTLINVIGFTGYMCDSCVHSIQRKKLPRVKVATEETGDSLF